jgi:hypothetical protein
MLRRLICFVSVLVALVLADCTSAGLVANWKFDNDRADSVGLLNWKLENGAGYSTDSKEGSHALSLDGTDDCAIQPAVGILGETFDTRTVALWFKVDSNNVTQVLYDEGGASSGMGIRINADYLQAAVRNAGIDVIASAALDSTDWTHTAATFDNGSLRLYINGEERAMASASFTKVAGHKNPAGIGVRNNQDAFGKRGTGDYFGGLIDDVRIYDNVLSADEIKELTATQPEKVIEPPEREQPEAKPEQVEPEEKKPEKPEPEEPKPTEAEPEKPKPEEPKPEKYVPDRILRSITYYIGPELYSYKYEEPGLMEQKGIFYGVAFGATHRDWIPDSPGQAFSDDKTMVRAEGRFAFGEVDYDGSIVNLATGEETPYSYDGKEDYVFEGRLLLGPEWLSSDILSTLYGGIGYRYLNDDPASDPYGYERESNYYYIPIGFEIDTDLRTGWSLAGGIEYDYFLWGLQRSHVGIEIENEQNDGYGYRASIKLQKKSKDMVFVIEPFFRYWDIDDSEVEIIWPYYFLEPENNTKEYGIQLIFIF